MKTSIAADIHYALKQFDWLLKDAGRYGALMLAGDLIDSSAIASVDAQVLVVRTHLDRVSNRAPVILCSGNHDLDRARNGARVAGWLGALDDFGICMDGSTVALGCVMISALPWWDGPFARAAVAAQLAREAEWRRVTWVRAHTRRRLARRQARVNGIHQPNGRRSDPDGLPFRAAMTPGMRYSADQARPLPSPVWVRA